MGAEIDTTKASGKLVFGIFASLAEFERELIRERTIAGLASARSGRWTESHFDKSKHQDGQGSQGLDGPVYPELGHAN
jgi:DNA invertase Pin-like site-specific DNA recombinase